LQFSLLAENFHHLYAILSELKVGVLDGLRKEAKQKYNDALKAYVTQYFGRPLEKLNVSYLRLSYFMGMESQFQILSIYGVRQ
jgi:hypothetical protein